MGCGDRNESRRELVFAFNPFPPNESQCENTSLRVILRSPPLLLADEEESRAALKIAGVGAALVAARGPPPGGFWPQGGQPQGLPLHARNDIFMVSGRPLADGHERLL